MLLNLLQPIYIVLLLSLLVFVYIATPIICGIIVPSLQSSVVVVVVVVVVIIIIVITAAVVHIDETNMIQCCITCCITTLPLVVSTGAVGLFHLYWYQEQLLLLLLEASAIIGGGGGGGGGGRTSNKVLNCHHELGIKLNKPTVCSQFLTISLEVKNHMVSYNIVKMIIDLIQFICIGNQSIITSFFVIDAELCDF